MFLEPGTLIALVAMAALGMGCDRILFGPDSGDENASTMMQLKPDGSGAVGDPAPSCDDYCDEISQVCPKNYGQQYGDATECRGFCEHLRQLGELSCRFRALPNRADIDNAAQCEKAGPGGLGNAASDTCGSGPCGSYCSLMASICQGKPLFFNNQAFVANTGDACISQCTTALEGTDVGYSWSMDAKGNSLACRIHHLGLALTQDYDQHCGHAGADPQYGNDCLPPSTSDASDGLPH